MFISIITLYFLLSVALLSPLIHIESLRGLVVTQMVFYNISIICGITLELFNHKFSSAISTNTQRNILMGINALIFPIIISQSVSVLGELTIPTKRLLVTKTVLDILFFTYTFFYLLYPYIAKNNTPVNFATTLFDMDL